MDVILNIVTFAHVLAGFMALIVFWVPAFTRKGGVNHRRVGRLYVNLMWLVVVTAIILSVKNAFIGRTQMAVFLGFLAILTAKPLWLGIAVLDSKRSMGRAYHNAIIWLNIIVVTAGLGLIAYGVSLGGKGNAALMYVFGGLGVTGLVDLWVYAAPIFGIEPTREDQRMRWMKEHISNMGVSGIAAHTAFLAFGANSVLPQSYVGEGGLGLAAWVSPTIIGVIAIRWSVRKYQPKVTA